MRKPRVIVSYNSTMGGVDRAEKAQTFYQTMRKKQKKYYKKIFRHLLEQCLWKAFILFKMNSCKRITHEDL